MQVEPTFAVARFANKFDTAPRRDEWTLAQLWLALSRFSTRAEKNGPLWSPARLVRRLAHGLTDPA